AEVEPGADLAQRCRLLADHRLGAALLERQRRGQPADPAADDGDAWRARHSTPLLDGQLEHDPEKWTPVFGKDHAPPKVLAAGRCGFLILHLASRLSHSSSFLWRMLGVDRQRRNRATLSRATAGAAQPTGGALDADPSAARSAPF